MCCDDACVLCVVEACVQCVAMTHACDFLHWCMRAICCGNAVGRLGVGGGGLIHVGEVSGEAETAGFDDHFREENEAECHVERLQRTLESVTIRLLVEVARVIDGHEDCVDHDAADDEIAEGLAWKDGGKLEEGRRARANT